jgi:hypothetical protein
MAVIVPVVSKFDPKGLKQAKSGFSSLSKSLKTSLGAIGLATSLAGVVTQLNAMGKAAVADAKSQALLANAMRNTIGASNAQIATTESAVQNFSTLYAVLDDQIRPAMSQFVRVTGDAEKATKLTDLALNVAAGTGRDLGSVTIALSKAYQGNTASLGRLGINVKGLKDPLGALEKQFAGAAQTAANVDPYKRMEVALDNAQETIGAALIPAMTALADVITSQAFSDGIEGIASDFGDLVLGFIAISDNIDGTVKDINESLSNLGVEVDNSGWNAFIANIFSGFTILRGIVALGGIKRRQDALLKGSGFNTTTLEGIYKASGYTFGDVADPDPDPDPKNKGLTEAQKKAQAAAKKRAEAAKKVAAEAARIAKEAAEALQAEKEALAEFSLELKELAVSIKPLVDIGREIGQFEQTTVDSFDAITESIKAGIANKTIIDQAGQNLLAYVATERKALTAIAQQRDELANKRSLVQTLIGDVKASVVGFANITEMLEKQTKQVEKTVTRMVNGISIATKTTIEEVVSGNGIVGNLSNVVTKTKAFAVQLKELRKLGLDDNLYKQIVDAGIEAGSATAAEIIKGGAGTINELNALFAELEAAGTAIAEDTALVMYNNGVEVAGGLVAGLMSQEQALVNAAMALADAFSKTFNSMVADLKVPSEEMRQVTLSIADVAKGNTGIEGAGSNITRSLASRYLYNAQLTGAEAPKTISITVNAGIGTNGKAVGQAIQSELNKYLKSSAYI